MSVREYFNSTLSQYGMGLVDGNAVGDHMNNGGTSVGEKYVHLSHFSGSIITLQFFRLLLQGNTDYVFPLEKSARNEPNYSEPSLLLVKN